MDLSRYFPTLPTACTASVLVTAIGRVIMRAFMKIRLHCRTLLSTWLMRFYRENEVLAHVASVVWGKYKKSAGLRVERMFYAVPAVVRGLRKEWRALEHTGVLKRGRLRCRIPDNLGGRGYRRQRGVLTDCRREVSWTASPATTAGTDRDRWNSSKCVYLCVAVSFDRK